MSTVQASRWITGRYRLGERGGKHEIQGAAAVRDGNQVVMRLFACSNQVMMWPSAYREDITVTMPIESAVNLSDALWATFKAKQHATPALVQLAEASPPIKGYYRLGERGDRHEIYGASAVYYGPCYPYADLVELMLYSLWRKIRVEMPIKSAVNLSASLWAAYDDE